MKKLLTILSVLLILITSGCDKVDPNKDTDKDLGKVTGNVVRESGEFVEPESIKVQEEKSKCSDECTSFSCEEYNYISCLSGEDGCKYNHNEGKVIGKCNVHCLKDFDCEKNQECNAYYRCVPKEEVKQETKEEIVSSMNKDIKVDYLTYKITKVETFTKMGTSIFKKETNGKFVKVYLSITNNAKETKQIFTPRFRLIDNQDRKFDRLPDDMFYITDYLELGKQLQPSLTVIGAIVFEVPKDSTDLKLEVKGDWLSTTRIIVALTNVQNVGTDTTLKEKQDEMVNEAMEEGQRQMEEIMSKCNSPFKCSSGCAKYSDVGQKDCPSGQVCCMIEQSEVDQQIEEWNQQAQQQVDELMKQYGLG